LSSNRAGSYAKHSGQVPAYSSQSGSLERGALTDHHVGSGGDADRILARRSGTDVRSLRRFALNPTTAATSTLTMPTRSGSTSAAALTISWVSHCS
jgi:hypothetical protein